MGGGSQTPTDSPVNTGEGGFDERKSPSASASVTGSTTGGSADTTTTNSGSDTSVSTQEETQREGDVGESTTGVSGSPNIASELWKNNNNSAEEYAATYDLGYDSELAEHLKSQPTHALEEKFNEAKKQAGDGGRLSRGDKFIGGMLASRSDSSVQMSDVTRIETTTTSISRDMSIDEFKEQITGDLNETVATMDEYVAGKVASKLDTIEIKDLGKTDDGKTIGGRYDMAGTMIVNPEKQQNTESTVTHELAHVVEQSYNSLANVRNDTDESPETFTVERQTLREMDVEGEPADIAEANAFNDGIENITKDFYRAARGENVPGMRKSMRNYQLTNSSETLAVGFGKYQENFISMSNNQSDLVEHIDTHITGATWTDRNMNELRTTGGVQSPRIQKPHTPIGATSESVGEVVKVNYNTPQPDPVYDELSDRTHVTGHVTEVTDDSITVMVDGTEETVPIDNIDSVQTRDWNEN